MDDGGRNRNDDARKMLRNRIHVSNTKKPLHFYLNLTKRCLGLHKAVVISGLGRSITTAVIISEMMKGVATQIAIVTSTVPITHESSGHTYLKSKIEIVMARGINPQLDYYNSMAAPGIF